MICRRSCVVSTRRPWARRSLATNHSDDGGAATRGWCSSGAAETSGGRAASSTSAITHCRPICATPIGVRANRRSSCRHGCVPRVLLTPMPRTECDPVNSISPLRFFRVVPTQPMLIVWTFMVVMAVGSMALVYEPSRSGDLMRPVLLLQLFAASSGFEVPARRGHYDLLLTSGHRRIWVALVHWTTSIAPGVLAWLVLAAVEVAARRGADTKLLASGTCAAMGLVSTMPWAITVRLPRFSGGIGWLLVLTLSTSVLSSGRMPSS